MLRRLGTWNGFTIVVPCLAFFCFLEILPFCGTNCIFTNPLSKPKATTFRALSPLTPFAAISRCCNSKDLFMILSISTVQSNSFESYFRKLSYENIIFNLYQLGTQQWQRQEWQKLRLKAWRSSCFDKVPKKCLNWF